MTTFTTHLHAEVDTTANTLAALDRPVCPCRRADEALAALRAGTPSAIAVVPWDSAATARPTRPTSWCCGGWRAIASTSSIRWSPACRPATATLGGPERGPLRRREAGGAESMALSTFEPLHGPGRPGPAGLTPRGPLGGGGSAQAQALRGDRGEFPGATGWAGQVEDRPAG